MRYEFRCVSCGRVKTFPTRVPTPLSHESADELCQGPWRRVWSFGVAWPQDQRGHD